VSQQRHTSDTRILDARTLEADFPALLPWLSPGLRVLDVGCGTGAITAGMARLVGPSGRVVGIDREDEQIRRAIGQTADTPWLHFAVGDVLDLPFVAEFDLVAIARTLQWIAESELSTAMSQLSRALAPGGRLVALDYNHSNHGWTPEPPPELPSFLERFRAWREASGWHTDVLSVLPAFCAGAGMVDAWVDGADVVIRRGDAAFAVMSRIWPRVIETIGPRMVADGFLSETARDRALAVTSPWCDGELVEQTMAARVMTATRQTE
jgi:SAM-dependent methyltransferase